MATVVHGIVFLSSLAILWFFAGVLVESVGRIARRFCRNGFFTAFFLLGFLTSISEFSVALNSSIAGVPQVSVGNLVGASFVLLFLIVPLLAIAGRGITLNEAVSKRNILLILGATALPVLLVIDGNVTKSEGLLALLAYATVAYFLYRHKGAIDACEVPLEDGRVSRHLLADIVRIFLGAVAIFLAAHFLVEQAVFFAVSLSVPVSLVGLLLLSVGTNIPEIVIAIRAILGGRSDIAFGDYLGSAAMNTVVFGVLALLSGTFTLEASQFIMTAALFMVGLAFLYIFAHTKHYISRSEAMALLVFYAAFLALQFVNLARFAG